MPNYRDPIAHMRNVTVTAQPAKPVTQPAGSYEAFGTKDRTERLRIRRKDGICRAPAYAAMFDVIYDSKECDLCILVFSFVWFKVKGRNLHPLFLALEAQTADFIQEYDAGFWVDTPLQPDQPVIESIEVMQDKLKDLEELLEAHGKQPA